MITPSFGLAATERVLPKLALDFTTASLDSRVTFTRTTGTSNPATYVASNGYITSATNNQPRFDYDPIALTCKGLLIEESRINLFTSSASPSGANTNLVTSTPTATPPDGVSASVNKIAASAVAGGHYFQNSITVSTTTAYTWSIFVKADGITAINLLMAQSTSPFTNHASISFNLTTGTVTSATVGSGTITTYPNGWYRLTATGTSSSTGELYRLSLLNPGSSFTGDGVSGVLVWGQQWEAGAFSTSYIPTTTTALTRNADVATMTGTNFSDWFNAAQGTFMFQGVNYDVASTRVMIDVTDGTLNERIQLSTATNKYFMADGGSTQANFGTGSITANAVYKIVAAYKVNDLAFALNGAATQTDNTATLPTVNQMTIGTRAVFVNSNQYSGWLQKLNYYPQRLTNAEVQAFSK